MLDADTLFFRSPMEVWQSPKYIKTGTLFFHDRVSSDHEYLASRREERHNITHLEEYLSDFDVEPFHHLDRVQRPRAISTSTATRHESVQLHFEPSEFLITSHAWNHSTGHQADSSLMLWNKKRQPRATVILGSFVANGGSGRPPSYGDKELYFTACELAETAYAFSDFGTGAIGLDARQVDTPGRSVLCGDALHYLPDALGLNGDPPTLYINSDHITSWKPTDRLYITKARPASLFPGKFEDRGLTHECPFDVTLDRITDMELSLFTRRQNFHAIAKRWNSTTP
ncbi:mannosyltransferase [Fragilaria crotonensis]|nr:mannosyltransferase [Fragilaria crotonensis]